MTFGPSNAQSSYLPPEFDLPEDNKTFRDFISKRERLTASILNIKEIAQYENKELLTAQQWFSTTQVKRYSFRTTVDFGALVSPGSKSVAHGILNINANWIFTKILAVARNPAIPAWIPIPWSDGINSVTIIVGSSLVTINTNTAAFAGYDQCYVILEYIKA